MPFEIIRLGSNASAAEFLAVAKLHETELQAGLLAKLGSGFLSDLYREMAADPDCVLMVAKEGDRVRGFISGTSDMGRFYRRFMRRRGIGLVARLLPYLLRRGSLSTMRSFQRYLRSPRAPNLPAAELTSMAVAPDRSRNGVGRALFGAFREHLRSREIAEFKVSAATTQVAALGFYPAVGARRVGADQLGELDVVVFVCRTAP